MTQANMVQEGRAKPATRNNRRTTIRYRCAPATLGKVISGDDLELQHAWIIDLSRQGIGMQLVRPIEPGKSIVIALRSSDGMTVRELPASVMRCTAQPQGDWTVGCEFNELLTPEELEQLL